MSSISNAKALSILQSAQDSRYRAQSNADVAAKGAQAGAKLDSAKATLKQTQAEQQSSLVKVGSNVAGMGLNYKVMLKSQEMQNSTKTPTDRSGAIGAGLNAAAQGNGVGSLVTQGVDAIDQNVGAQAAGNQAKIDGKYAELSSTVSDQQADAAKTGKDAALKGIDSINELAKDMFQRASQVINKAFGG